jgi:FlaA1/EpsC-like NDP-sugar epimerase
MLRSESRNGLAHEGDGLTVNTEEARISTLVSRLVPDPMAARDFENWIALVTGTGGAIGSCVVEEFVRSQTWVRCHTLR